MVECNKLHAKRLKEDSRNIKYKKKKSLKKIIYLKQWLMIYATFSAIPGIN